MDEFKIIDGIDYGIKKDGTFISFKYGKVKIRRPQVVRGYKSVMIEFNGKNKAMYIHRLIAIYFIPNPENKPEVNHIDGNKQNNSIENLEWVTRKENVNHAWAKGLSKVHASTNRAIAKSKSKLVINAENGIFYESATEAANSYNINPNTLGHYLRGRMKNRSSLMYV